MTGNEIRRTFLEYFKKKKHIKIPSSSLVPVGDTSILFTNSGMVQFKKIFLGNQVAKYSRVTSSQKCVRAGGKHNDLESVGKTLKHQTFFEMLGNFSFGDYFKEKAIVFAWDLLTNKYKLPVNKLWVSVYEKDYETYKIWKDKIGIEKKRIVYMGKKENFWSMGETGPCGPCSEIHIDRGNDSECKNLNCNPSCSCNRFLELWNLVFMEFNKNQNGDLSILPSLSIDTGLGLERLSSVIQGVQDNFLTDLLYPIVKKVEEISEIKFGNKKEHDTSMKVIADHAKASTFLIGDGVIPSNEGKGYVLRRILRRAIRHGKILNMENLFLTKIVDTISHVMNAEYPELSKSREYIKKVIEQEELRFLKTIDLGLKLLNNVLDKIEKDNGSILPGNLIFKFHDTHGLPIDLINDTARDRKIVLDFDKFNQNMNIQKKKSYVKKNTINKKSYYDNFKGVKSVFSGYYHLNTTAKVVLILKDNKIVSKAYCEDLIDLVTNITTFYGESGGQVGDIGIILGENLEIIVNNTIINESKIILHKCKIIKGEIITGQNVNLEVNKNNRLNISRNHTATHILNSTLRKEFGNNLRQSGSLVTSKRLRFDFNFFFEISKEKLKTIEDKINKKILENLKVKTSKNLFKNIDKSKTLTLFRKKYEKGVRIVEIGKYSTELCKGTHVSMTGKIGLFNIIYERGISSGVRRIEGITGLSFYNYFKKIENTIKKASLELKVPINLFMEKLVSIKSKNKLFKSKIKLLETDNSILKIKLKNNLSSAHLKNELIKPEYVKINNIKVKLEKVESNSPENLRKMMDFLKKDVGSGIIVIGSEFNGKAILSIGVTKDLTKKYNAAILVKKIAKIIGGNGGGRSDMAQAGGNKPKNINKALREVKKIISKN